ncbi:RNA polymerase sigma factor [Chondromyces apiculatus]|uniref:RNA polymerase sigma-70 factor, ECF subfamily n=1 Tax=Chondromyces apiculatus DSM 436 TaxID=1192034 RepID=A0A017T8N0_9BACT|nr:RNA polymerase sigma factor [Chondromyces apiculatus]EYF05603.1 RNA polymerase sigma-70 factor, ECF subfamily [Chondromyces apiculatus DSM 436]
MLARPAAQPPTRTRTRLQTPSKSQLGTSRSGQRGDEGPVSEPPPSGVRLKARAKVVSPSAPPPSGVRLKPRAKIAAVSEVRQAKGAAVSDVRQAIVRLHGEMIGHAVRLSGSESLAEDIVQDAIERALRFEASYQPGTNVRGWLHQIVFSVFISRCRRSRRERDALDKLALDPCAWTCPQEQRTVMRTLPDGMKKALAKLPAHFRGVLVMIDLEELTYKDVSFILEVPMGTVMSRLHRARRMLAEAVERMPDGPLSIAA